MGNRSLDQWSSRSAFVCPIWTAVLRDAEAPERSLSQHRPDRTEIDVPADENRVVEFFAKY